MIRLTMIFVLVSASAFASDVIELKNGMTFNHKGHQTERVGKCFVCHENVAVSRDETKVVTTRPGKIAGFGREWAHKNCTDCHDLFGEGPVTCKECHKKYVSSIQNERRFL